MEKEQAPPKQDFYNRLRLSTNPIRAEEFVFLRPEYTNPMETQKHKLETIGDSPYLVVAPQNETVVFDIDGQYERISRYWVV